MPIDPDIKIAAENAGAWPFELARAIAKRRTTKEPVIFATGYGPSGAPHIGTFGEVARTCMVRHAFRVLTEDKIPTRLLCISDDMDGLRSIADDAPPGLEEHLQKPLADIPDPFGTHAGYGAHMNARLRKFLDRFGFEYEFLSSAEQYRSGRYDDILLTALQRYDDIMAVMLPTLREDRRRSYSPFLPISPDSGKVLYAPLTGRDARAGTISFIDEDNVEKTVPVTGGAVKLQWKPDFGMRWAALGVDFEMFGKDHRANAPIYSRICKILGGEAPVQFVYELFLDEHGEKISKSRGNGVTIDEWLSYAPAASLSLLQYVKPRTAKRLYPGMIPRLADEYLTHLQKWPEQSASQRLENPLWHIHAGDPPQPEMPVSYSMLLNLCIAANASDADRLWRFLQRYVPDQTRNALLEQMMQNALNYYNERVKPHLRPRQATAKEQDAMLELAACLDADADNGDATYWQEQLFAIGKKHGFAPIGEWFRALYEVLFGASSGPRFGGFIAIYGPTDAAALIRSRLQE